MRLRYLGDFLELEVEDHGAGLPAQLTKGGIGMVAMRERAEILGGHIEFTQPASGGAIVCLRVPREKAGADGR